jgi:hypothetical protein
MMPAIPKGWSILIRWVDHRQKCPINNKKNPREDEFQAGTADRRSSRQSGNGPLQSGLDIHYIQHYNNCELINEYNRFGKGL